MPPRNNSLRCYPGWCSLFARRTRFLWLLLVATAALLHVAGLALLLLPLPTAILVARYALAVAVTVNAMAVIWQASQV